MRKDPSGAGPGGERANGDPAESAGAGGWPTIPEAIRAHGLTRAEAPALVGPGFAPVTFGALTRFLDEAREALAGVGVGPETRVGLVVPPGYRGALLTLAVASQAQLAPLNPSLTPGEFVEEVRRVAMDALIAPDWLDTPLPAGFDQMAPLVLRAGLGDDLRLSLSSTGAKGTPAHDRTVTPGSIALLLRSSGTTGDPKQIPVTHRNLVAMARKMAGWFDLSPQDRIPCTLPLYYAAGLKTTLFVPLIIGASVGIPAPGQTYDVAEWIEEIRPTVLSVAPASLRGILDRFAAAPTRPVTPFLRFAICGAAYLPDALRREAEDLLGVPVIEYYGLSEAGAMAANPAPPGLRKPGTVGLPAPGELKLVGEGGKPVPQGEAGEIVLSGPSVTPGYLTARDREPSGVESGWLSTGDLGRFDEDGYLSIVGRLKEIINRGGEKVSPYEVEKALLRHPAVLDAGVFGVPHPRLGENVAAAVVLRPGLIATPEEIRRSLEDQLVRFKIPQTIAVVETLPRGPTGKILRAELARAMANRARERSARPDRMLEHQIMAIWTRLLKRADFGIDDDFFELGGDSLLAAEMLVEVEGLAHRSVPQSQLATSLTIRMLADAVCSDLGPGRELLTQVRDGQGTPFFFCHGDYTTRGLFALRLIELADPDRPVYLLHFYQDLHRPDLTIEEIAGSYVDEIRKARPDGPLVIGGYCNGGLVAWELTRRLRQAGRDVRALLLIETPSLNARPMFRVMHGLTRMLGAVLPGRSGEVMRQEAMRSLWHRMRGYGTFGSLFLHAARRAARRFAKRTGKAPPAGGDAAPSPHWLYQRTLSRYAPPPLDAPITCFIARDARLMDTDPHFWRALTPQVSVVDLPGNHHTVVTAEAADLSQALRRTLTLYP